MCLLKKYNAHPHNRPIIAKEDIICYKQVCRHSCGLYETPYTNTIIPTACIENKVPFKAKINDIFEFFMDHVLGKYHIVEDGFIHVYTYPRYQFNHLTFECIIPKGTKYFIGIEHDLAAKEIIFLKRL